MEMVLPPDGGRLSIPGSEDRSLSPHFGKVEQGTLLLLLWARNLGAWHLSCVRELQKHKIERDSYGVAHENWPCISV